MPWFPCPPCCASSSRIRRGNNCCDDIPICMLVDVYDLANSPISPTCRDCAEMNGRYQLDYADPADPVVQALFGPGYEQPPNCMDYFLVLDPGFCTGILNAVFLEMCCIEPDHVWDVAFSFGFTLGGVGYNAHMTWELGDLPITSRECLSDFDGTVLIGSDTNEFFCSNNGVDASTNVTIYPCEGFANCCGTTPPVVGGSVGIAAIAGVGGCAANPLHPTNGDHSLTYRGTGAYNPCGGDNFPRGSMKWVADAGTYALLAFCQADHIDLVFYFFTCNVDGSLGNEIIWYGTAPLGGCDFSGIVLSLNADLFGCADPTSTVTLHDFVL